MKTLRTKWDIIVGIVGITLIIGSLGVLGLECFFNNNPSTTIPIICTVIMLFIGCPLAIIGCYYERKE